LINWRDIRPVSEAEEIECLPSLMPKISKYKTKFDGCWSDWIRMALWKCYCGKNLVWSESSKSDTFICSLCGREWCVDRVDLSICRITKDKAVLHELRL